eukprot:PhF_6_TR43601/c0_g1_i1/m.66965
MNQYYKMLTSMSPNERRQVAYDLHRQRTEFDAAKKSFSEFHYVFQQHPQPLASHQQYPYETTTAPSHRYGGPPTVTVKRGRHCLVEAEADTVQSRGEDRRINQQIEAQRLRERRHQQELKENYDLGVRRASTPSMRGRPLW